VHMLLHQVMLVLCHRKARLATVRSTTDAHCMTLLHDAPCRLAVCTLGCFG